MQTKAFTLWELLAVLVIILVVAAILFPVFAKSHGCSRCLSCASNMKQIGLGIVQYAQDNDGMMPDIARAPGSPDTWRWATHAYLRYKDIHHCPSREKGSCLDSYPLSYAANYSGNYNGSRLDKGDGAFAGPGSLPLSLSDFKNPAHLIELCEVADSPAPEFNIDNAVRFGPDRHILWAGHNSRSNLLFADGHVKFLSLTQTAWYTTSDVMGAPVQRNLWYRDGRKPLSATGVAILAEAEKRGADRP